jgi:hypothetical protein
VSTREKERGECRLEAWLYHPLHSTEERDLGQRHREGTEREGIGGLALPSPTLYRGMGSCLAPERRNRESVDWGPGSTVLYTLPGNVFLVITPERRKGREEMGVLATLYATLYQGTGYQREGTGREAMGGLTTLYPTIYRRTGSWSAPERRDPDGEKGDIGPGYPLPYPLCHPLPDTQYPLIQRVESDY